MPGLGPGIPETCSVVSGSLWMAGPNPAMNGWSAAERDTFAGLLTRFTAALDETPS